MSPLGNSPNSKARLAHTSTDIDAPGADGSAKLKSKRTATKIALERVAGLPRHHSPACAGPGPEVAQPTADLTAKSTTAHEHRRRPAARFLAGSLWANPHGRPRTIRFELLVRGVWVRIPPGSPSSIPVNPLCRGSAGYPSSASQLGSPRCPRRVTLRV